MTNTRAVMARIIEQATPEQAKSLHEELNYGTRYAFWSRAVCLGLATEEEKEDARRSFGDLWHYRGD